MVAEPPTQAGSILAPTEPRAFLVIHVAELDRASRVIELPDRVDVTFGRSRGATIVIEHERLSRMHTRVRRTGDVVVVEDLGSRNGTRVNGVPIQGVCRVVAGDEITIGPIQAVVGATSGLNRPGPIVDSALGEHRLAAEIDRAVRYRRPVTVALLRVTSDSAIDAIAKTLRPMDLIADDTGDDYLVILPELDRQSGAAAIARLVEIARAKGSEPTVTTAVCPDDATAAGTLMSILRTGLRGGSSLPARVAPVASKQPIVLDPAMQRIYELVDRVADSTMTVLILGETGVGKELVAEAIHARSSRRDQRIVKLNCAALPETLLESELFGHERGAFTGADRRHIGFFETADGGTLVLDEIGEMPLAMQAKLLRVLERKLITRVGATDEIPVDVRLIAATHRDLDVEVREGRFRQDLMFRISGFTLVVPPLRDRPCELIPLAEHFIHDIAAQQGRKPPVLTADAIDALAGYAWPGNVRELQNAIERAMVLCGDTLGSADLPDSLLAETRRTRPIRATTDVKERLVEVERAAIVEALAIAGNNQTHAARRLGMSRRALIYKMEKYGLKPEAHR